MHAGLPLSFVCRCDFLCHFILIFTRGYPPFFELVFKSVEAFLVRIIRVRFQAGAFVERDDYSSGVFKTKEVADFINFISCNVYRI